MAGVSLADVAGLAHTTLGCLWWRAWSRLAQRHFVWQAWHLRTSRHQCHFCVAGVATYGTGLALVARLVAYGVAVFCVAGVALGDIDVLILWQAWRLVT